MARRRKNDGLNLLLGIGLKAGKAAYKELTKEPKRKTPPRRNVQNTASSYGFSNGNLSDNTSYTPKQEEQNNGCGGIFIVLILLVLFIVIVVNSCN